MLLDVAGKIVTSFYHPLRAPEIRKPVPCYRWVFTGPFLVTAGCLLHPLKNPSRASMFFGSTTSDTSVDISSPDVRVPKTERGLTLIRTHDHNRATLRVDTVHVVCMAIAVIVALVIEENLVRVCDVLLVLQVQRST